MTTGVDVFLSWNPKRGGQEAVCLSLGCWRTFFIPIPPGGLTFREF